jgi:hypothetical protein
MLRHMGERAQLDDIDLALFEHVVGYRQSTSGTVATPRRWDEDGVLERAAPSLSRSEEIVALASREKWSRQEYARWRHLIDTEPFEIREVQQIDRSVPPLTLWRFVDLLFLKVRIGCTDSTRIFEEISEPDTDLAVASAVCLAFAGHVPLATAMNLYFRFHRLPFDSIISGSSDPTMFSIATGIRAAIELSPDDPRTLDDHSLTVYCIITGSGVEDF